MTKKTLCLIVGVASLVLANFLRSPTPFYKSRNNLPYMSYGKKSRETILFITSRNSTREEAHKLNKRIREYFSGDAKMTCSEKETKDGEFIYEHRIVVTNEQNLNLLRLIEDFRKKQNIQITTAIY